MGSRADKTLKEIEALRAGLEHKLGELEQRLPIAGMGRKAAAMLAGSGAGGTMLALAVRRLRGGRRGGRRKSDAGPPAVTVNVLPRGASWIAATGLAVWAGARLYEAYNRVKSNADGSFRPAVVKPIPESSRPQTSSGG